MDIIIHSMGMPFNGETINTKSLGGSESAAFYQAKELAARGHRVHVFTTAREPGVWDGVTYVPLGNVSQATPMGDAFEHYARNTPHDVLIVQRHPAAFHHQFASKVNIWQLHDLALHRTAGMVNHGMWSIDAVTVVSQWHKDQVCEVYGFGKDFVQVVRNGVDPMLYMNSMEACDDIVRQEIPKYEGDGFKMLYQSRPERGLEHLVRPGGIMDKLADSEAHLYVCGYDNTTQQMAGYYKQLEDWGKQLGNVTFLGALTKSQLAALQRSCDLLIYPTEFKEVSCITAMEAMHAGLPMLTSIAGALPETCELLGAGVHFVKLKDGKADEDVFINQARHLMNNELILSEMKRKQVNAANYATWVAAVDKLEAVIENCFEKRKTSLTAVVRNAIEHSDIEFAKWCNQQSMGDEDYTNIDHANIAELERMYAFLDNQTKYVEHYDEHQANYYDVFEDKVIGEDVTQSTRFRGVASFIGREMQKRGNKLTMLDYGCAHGHYLMPIAGSFPESRFVGVDISARAIGAAIKWAQKMQLTNVELVNGDQDSLTVDEMCEIDGTTGQPILFDVILAGEVLEHVQDYAGLLEKFRGILAPGGVIIVTTPLGRWEWTGTNEFRKAREHVHHFDRDDIREICSENVVDILCAPAGHDKTGAALGSWVWCVQPTVEFEYVNYARKLKTYTPRQTVSACLIVKDGERTLRRCIESFIDWVDEVIVAVDPSTTDRTREIVSNLALDYGLKSFVVIDGLEALKEGFDAARNHSITHANGDWILWCDADEEIQQPWNLWKYLRQSHHQGFGFPQVHYSTNPPQVLTTDYPLRLFRRNGKVKFYGLVHEHPESEVGKGVDHATVRHDVQFLHCGYVDEDARRGRFQRNLPLLYRDRERYPDRGLNRYLMLRDIAQGIMFEQEQTQGFVTNGQPERAEIAIKIYEEMLEKDPVRSIIEALKYYSHCVAVLGRGFESKVMMEFKNDHAPDLNSNLSTEGRFHSREFFAKFVSKLHEEATKQYESEYL